MVAKHARYDIREDKNFEDADASEIDEEKKRIIKEFNSKYCKENQSPFSDGKTVFT